MIGEFFILITDIFLIIINFIYKSVYNIINYKNFKNNLKSYVKEDIGDSNYFYDLVEDNDSNNPIKNIVNGFKANFNNNYSYDFLNNNEVQENLVFDKITDRVSVLNIEKINNKIKLDDSFVKKLLILSLIVFLIFNYFFNMEFALLAILIPFFFIYFALHLGDFKRKSLYQLASRELPFVLRHMSTELKSGKGLNDTLISVADSDYGVLSIEFNRLIHEIQYGKSLKDGLIEMSNRVNSEGLTRAVYQIISTNELGGNLSDTLLILADDVSFDMRIKLKDYAQKLNAFIMIYTFLVILAPVVILIIIMAASTVIGNILPSEGLYLIYAIFFPMIILFMALMIRKLEPKI